MILDGFGYNESDYGNAIAASDMPNYRRIFESSPHTVINASGMAVGLPEGQMGNSEVGHTNIGAGRIVYQPLTKITKAISDGDFFDNPVLKDAVRSAAENGSTLHLMGLLSDGGVHSHIDHLFALIDFAKREGVRDLCVHAFMDGRDVSPTSGKGYVERLLEKFSDAGIGRISTIGGRYYGMDRDTNWDRIKKAYDAAVYGIGPAEPDPVAYLSRNYENGITDEFIVPAVVSENSVIKDGDSVIFFNFRPDRAREMTRAITEDVFTGFDRKRLMVKYVCMKQYDASFKNVDIAFPPDDLSNTLGEYLSSKGLRQLRIAETEKYAHVTFFFNGGTESQYEGEDRILVPSPKVATYDLQPEMSAYEVTEKLLADLSENTHDVIILNFANTDMVGHTGVFSAAVKACEAVDECLGKVCGRIKELGGTALITADHGNADQMLMEDGSPCTSHSTNPVPFTVYNHECELRETGCLADIAPTILDIMGIDIPSEMTGVSLIRH